ncbi:MAG: uracil-DNA glycosylase [Prevotella sp.]|nr:uracil-DNA glycosylase [Prevotella sp.]
MNVNIEPSWFEALKGEFDKDYFVKLTRFVRAEYVAGTCFPPAGKIFNAFALCPFDNVKVVIIGQDPYHEPGQAEGLCFSVSDGTPLPPSLVNILKEVKDDVGAVPPLSQSALAAGRKMYNGSLRRWATQGVLLLNATLTVRAHQAGSHQRQGWETFTDAVIRTVSERKTHVVFILWGGYAKTKKALIDPARHRILEAVHPSPLSANRGGWFGNRHFSRCNEYLTSNGITPIVW